MNPTCFLFWFPPPPPFFIFLVFPGYLGAPATCPEIPLLAQWRFGAQAFKEGLEIPNAAFNWFTWVKVARCLVGINAVLCVSLPLSQPPLLPPTPRGHGTRLVFSHPVSMGVAQTFGAHVWRRQ